MIKENKDFIIIDFTGMFKAILSKMWLIILVGVMTALAAAGYAKIASSNAHVTPMYKSTVKLYIAGSTSTKQTGQSSFDDYMELMSSEKVTSQVLSRLQLNMSGKELISCVSAKWVSNTNMVHVSVTFPDAQLAKVILEELLKATSAYALEVLGTSPPRVYEEAAVPQKPSGSIGKSYSISKYGIIGFAGGFVLTATVVLVLFFMDKKLRNLKQIQDVTQLEVLTTVLKSEKAKSVSENDKAMQTLYGKVYAKCRAGRVITFVSPEKENKEEIIRMYAGFLKGIGKKVLCLDMNMYAPTGKNGDALLKYLNGEKIKLQDLIKNVDETECISCETPALNATELLGGEKFKGMLEELLDKYDYVLMNTSPMEYAMDALMVMEHSDINILVVEKDKTVVEAGEKSAEECRKQNSVTGVIVSNIKLQKKSRQFKQSYGKYLGMS